MAQTQLNYNEVMFGQNDKTFRYQKETITGAADLAVGTVLVEAGGKYRAAVDADKVNVGAAAIDASWRVLLSTAAVSGGDVLLVPTGVSGGVFKDKLVGVGLTLDDAVYNKLSMNNIVVVNGSNAMTVAGE